MRHTAKTHFNAEALFTANELQVFYALHKACVRNDAERGNSESWHGAPCAFLLERGSSKGKTVVTRRIQKSLTDLCIQQQDVQWEKIRSKTSASLTGVSLGQSRLELHSLISSWHFWKCELLNTQTVRTSEINGIFAKEQGVATHWITQVAFYCSSPLGHALFPAPQHFSCIAPTFLSPLFFFLYHLHIFYIFS